MPSARQFKWLTVRFGDVSVLWASHIRSILLSVCFTKGLLIAGLNPMNPSEVLLVEDNAGDALLVGQALAEYPTPIHLHIARDGEQALQLLGEPGFQPDLIILDLNIPKMSGHAVLALYPKKKTPVVVFSASENEADVDRAFALGAREFVHKPMDLDDYKTAVSGMVQKWAGHDSDDSRSVTS